MILFCSLEFKAPPQIADEENQNAVMTTIERDSFKLTETK